MGVTWPLALRLGSHLPLGTEGAGTVPLFNLWTLLWNADRLRQGYAGYWDAPIFYPEQGTFALSEPQPLTGLLFSLFEWLSGNPTAAYNLLLLLFLALNGQAADWLLRKLGVSSGPALLGGLLALGLPFVNNEWGVLQLTPLFPLFFALGSLWQFARWSGCRAARPGFRAARPGWRPALSLGGWSAAVFFFSGYYGLFLTLFLPLGGLCLARRVHWNRTVVLQLAAGGLLAGLLLLPLLPAQARLTAGYTRSEQTIADNSAELDEYARLYRRTQGARWTPWLLADDGSQRLYPGTALLVLGLVGLAAGWRDRPKRRWVLFAALGAALAFGLSLGLNLSIGEARPYQLLREHYPGFAQLRSPFRLALFVQLFLLGLAGLGLNALWQQGKGRRWLAVVVVVLGLAEVMVWPARLYTVPQTLTGQPWVRWLAQQPESGAVLMLPMSQSSKVEAFEPVVIGMIQALEHGRPLANGYSGFFPAGYRSLKRQMVHFPDEESVAYLQETGIRYLVIEPAWWTEEQAQRIKQWDTIFEPVYQGEKVIYRIE